MKILVIEARYYEAISEDLLKGALTQLQAAGAEVVKVNVPGALEIPHVISYAEKARAGYDGYVALGCVIRGETTHYDYVCLLYTSPSPRDATLSRMPSSA